jgi:tetratricopeptide (TPR) repeat protein
MIRAGRNDPCPCGSGRKFKRCCDGKQAQSTSSKSGGASSAIRAPSEQGGWSLRESAKKLIAVGRWADALPVLEERAQLSPSDPEALADLGLALFVCGRTKEAAECLQRAVALRPSFEAALVHLVKALDANGQPEEAGAACSRLARLARDGATRRRYLAAALIFEGKLEEAEKELRRVLLMAPEDATAKHMLGTLLSNMGKFGEAARELRAIVDVRPNAFQQLASVARITRDDRPLLARVSKIAKRRDLDATQRSQVHFGLGKAFDDLGDYAEAMRHYDLANGFRAQSGRLNREAISARFDWMMARFTAETFARMKQPTPCSGTDDLPLFILGMPRSGTTLVEQILSAHRDVAGGGELSFWHKRTDVLQSLGADPEDGDFLAKAAGDYHGILRQIDAEALRITDKQPMNFEVIWLIRLAMPRVRIIHCRRHPVDTCLSIYFSNFGAVHDYSWNREDLVFYYKQYERLIGHWRKALSPDRFTEVDYETLITHPEAETRRLVYFCGLDWDDTCLSPDKNDRVVKSRSHWQVRQPIYKTSIDRWRRYEPWLGELRELLPPKTQRDRL